MSDTVQEEYTSYMQVASRVNAIVGELKGNDFVPASIPTTIMGIERIILADGTIIIPERFGELKHEIVELMEFLAAPPEHPKAVKELIQSSPWYQLQGWYIKEGTFGIIRAEVRVYKPSESDGPLEVFARGIRMRLASFGICRAPTTPLYVSTNLRDYKTPISSR